MRRLDSLAISTAQRIQRNGIVIRMPEKLNERTDLTNEALYPLTLGILEILEIRGRQIETLEEQLMKIGTERNLKRQDTSHIFETTKTTNDMISEMETGMAL